MSWSPRNILRYGTVLLAGIIAGSRIVSAYVALQQWREWRGRDPSLADASLTFAEFDLMVAGLLLIGAGLIWWLARPRSGQAPGEVV